jgi:putative transposase
MFHRTFDYLIFLSLLRSAAARWSVEVHAYALMTNHFHVMATPSDTTGLSRMMQALGRSYVPLFNVRYGRTGGLWEGRYRSSTISDETYWLTCMRYVELNPVRAGIVSAPGAYRWSSFRAHASPTRDPLVSCHPLYLRLGATAGDRQRAWRAICDEALPPEQVSEIRTALKRGRTLGPMGGPRGHRGLTP